MGIKFTIPELEQAKEGIKSMLDTKLPIKASYWLIKASKKILNELKHYEETRLTTLKNYAILKEGTNDLDLEDSGNAKFENDEKLKQFFSEIDQLRSIEMELNITPINIETFGDIEISPNVLSMIQKIITD